MQPLLKGVGAILADAIGMAHTSLGADEGLGHFRGLDRQVLLHPVAGSPLVSAIRAASRLKSSVSFIISLVCSSKLKTIRWPADIRYKSISRRGIRAGDSGP